MAVLRRTTALGDEHALAVDEVLTLGTSAVIGLNEELEHQRHQATLLRDELSAAYRSAATAAARDVEAARHATEEVEARASAAAEAASAHARERESALQATQHALERCQRENFDLLRTVDRTAANSRLVEQKIARARQGASRILHALPASAAEAALEAEQLARVAAGEEVHEEEDIDVLLSRALERAMRLSEKGQAAAAEVALLRAELEAERASRARATEQERLAAEALQAADEHQELLRVELAETRSAREAADAAARRFQAILVQNAGSGSLGGGGLSPALSPQTTAAAGGHTMRNIQEGPLNGARHVVQSSSSMYEKLPPTALPPPPPPPPVVVPAPPLPLPSPSSKTSLIPSVYGHGAGSIQGAPGAQTPCTLPLSPASPLADDATAAASAAVSKLEKAVLETAKMTALLSKPTVIDSTPANE